MLLCVVPFFEPVFTIAWKIPLDGWVSTHTFSLSLSQHTEGHALTYLKYVTIASSTVMAKLVGWKSLASTNLNGLLV